MYICKCIYTVSQKNCEQLFLSELRQISNNVYEFLGVDEKIYKLICYINIFHLT